jgi:hypothetical protein
MAEVLRLGWKFKNEEEETNKVAMNEVSWLALDLTNTVKITLLATSTYKE